MPEPRSQILNQFDATEQMQVQTHQLFTAT